MITAFLIALAAQVFFIVAFGAIIFYIFMGLGLYRLAKRNNLDHAFLAWIPIANCFLIGQLAFDSKPYAWGLTLLKLFSSGNGVANKGTVDEIVNSANGTNLIDVAFYIMYFVAIFKIYKRYSNKAVLMLVFSIITGSALVPIFLFAIRNNNEIKK